MSIKLKQLKDVVARAKENEKLSSVLREEITRVTNSAVLVEDRDLGEICEDAIDHISTMNRLGHEPTRFKTSTLLKMVENVDPQVRRLAGKMLPEGQLYRLINDKDFYVRSEVATRVSMNELKTMIRKHPADDNLRTIYKTRLHEAEGMLYLSGKRLGDAGKQKDEPLLTDAWYDNMAGIIFRDVGHSTGFNVNMYNLARQFAQHSNASFGVDISVDKLVDALNDLIEAEDDKVLERTSALKESVNYLKTSSFLNETLILVPNDLDSVEELLESRVGGQEYLTRAEQIFSIIHNAPNRQQAKLLLREGIDSLDELPVSGVLQVETIRLVDEKALDRYVDIWNKSQMVEGNTLRISWQNYGNEIAFEVRG